MRVLICSKRPLLVMALAERLQRAGDDVVSIVDAPHSAHSTLREHLPEVVISDEWPSGTDRLVEDLDFTLMLLADQADTPSVDGSRRIVVLPERSATLHDILALVARLRERRGGPAPNGRATSSARPNENRRLATFLSAREREVVSQLVQGADTATLARRLRISRSTARDHVQNVLTKMHAHSRIELVSLAVREGLVDPTTGLWLGDVG